jgi:methylmalonyl-CoA mutase N-terminal domain/subunit
VADPLGGSFYVEALTDEMEERILAELDEIENLGGYVATIKSGWIHRKISDYFRQERELMESGQTRVVAENVYQTKADLPPVNVFRYPQGVAERQHQRLEKLRNSRDNQKVTAALTQLEEACRSGTNILPLAVECAEVGCSEGELFAVFKKAFGLWKPPVLW